MLVKAEEGVNCENEERTESSGLRSEEKSKSKSYGCH
jgi:hypothetical protein